MRRRARQCALQILYQLDVNRELDGSKLASLDVGAALADYWSSFERVSDDERAFAERLVRGVLEQLETVDRAIASAAQNWRLSRMGAVDRSLLRLAAYEIIACPDIPSAVSIDEAVELAKRFGGSESASFLNGVLDRLKQNQAESD